ncbi:tRNA (adenine(58)-N(1))-methyltransferase non-catalytic subunit TRM6 [Patella vulgata]|uniref:tRNA (adenine(58)-N(1))-methyltransferase non-catalytic subunit TRM6 n=1 Tax=Patella vulgata TaxID=6465 RepID=UPI00217F5042|nr:tRNA (adenine(58)-N(1))-methyltransferase non-catalytic subunit TRM6 [Patella vulgata]
MTENVIKEGTRIILQKGDDYKSCIVQKDSLIRMAKVRFNLSGLIGTKFGTLLKIENENLVVHSEGQTEIQPMDIQGCSTDRSNKELVESDENQKIKQEEIQQMKDSGMKGEQIVDKLVENSQTFQNKTEFSQDKYIKKKKQKHILLVRVLKPTTRLVFNLFYNRNPADIGYMRVDTYSQILSFANLIPGSNIGIIDTYRGLLVAAALELLGGTGSVIQLIPDNIFLKDCLKYYNLSEESLETHYHYNIENLATLEAEINKDDTLDPMGSSATTSTNVADMECESSDNLVIDDNQSANGNDATKPETEINNRKRKRVERQKKTPEELEAERAQRVKNSIKRKKAQKILLDKDLDGLIISSKFHPTPLLMRMLEFINPSRPVVIYSQHQEPLIDCYMKVKGSGKGVNLQLTETWYREYQVLPQRTHPAVRMTGNGGYLLTFTTADAS